MEELLCPTCYAPEPTYVDRAVLRAFCDQICRACWSIDAAPPLIPFAAGGKDDKDKGSSKKKRKKHTEKTKSFDDESGKKARKPKRQAEKAAGPSEAELRIRQEMQEYVAYGERRKQAIQSIVEENDAVLQERHANLTESLKAGAQQLSGLKDNHADVLHVVAAATNIRASIIVMHRVFLDNYTQAVNVRGLQASQIVGMSLDVVRKRDEDIVAAEADATQRLNVDMSNFPVYLTGEMTRSGAPVTASVAATTDTTEARTTAEIQRDASSRQELGWRHAFVDALATNLADAYRNEDARHACVSAVELQVLDLVGNNQLPGLRGMLDTAVQRLNSRYAFIYEPNMMEFIAALIASVYEEEASVVQREPTLARERDKKQKKRKEESEEEDEGSEFDVDLGWEPSPSEEEEEEEDDEKATVRTEVAPERSATLQYNKPSRRRRRGQRIAASERNIPFLIRHVQNAILADPDYQLGWFAQNGNFEPMMNFFINLIQVFRHFRKADVYDSEIVQPYYRSLGVMQFTTVTIDAEKEKHFHYLYEMVNMVYSRMIVEMGDFKSHKFDAVTKKLELYLFRLVVNGKGVLTHAKERLERRQWDPNVGSRANREMRDDPTGARNYNEAARKILHAYLSAKKLFHNRTEPDAAALKAMLAVVDPVELQSVEKEGEKKDKKFELEEKKRRESELEEELALHQEENDAADEGPLTQEQITRIKTNFQNRHKRERARKLSAKERYGNIIRGAVEKAGVYLLITNLIVGLLRYEGILGTTTRPYSLELRDPGLDVGQKETEGEPIVYDVSVSEESEEDVNDNDVIDVVRREREEQSLAPLSEEEIAALRESLKVEREKLLAEEDETAQERAEREKEASEYIEEQERAYKPGQRLYQDKEKKIKVSERRKKGEEDETEEEEELLWEEREEKKSRVKVLGGSPKRARKPLTEEERTRKNERAREARAKKNASTTTPTETDTASPASDEQLDSGEAGDEVSPTGTREEEVASEAEEEMTNANEEEEVPVMVGKEENQYPAEKEAAGYVGIKEEPFEWKGAGERIEILSDDDDDEVEVIYLRVPAKRDFY